MKKLTFWKSLFLLCALIVGTSTSWADETYNLTPDGTSTGSSSSSYITSLTEFTYDGITWKMNQWNPSSLQIKTNQDNATSEFRFYNTTAFEGRIKQVVISFQALGLKDTDNPGFMFVGGTSEVTATTGGTQGTWNSTDKTLTWTPGASDNYTYFALYQNGKVATGTNKLATSDAIVVTYESSGSTATTTTITSTGITNTDLKNGTAAGSLSASVTVTEGGAAVTGATVKWSSDDEDVATVDENTGVVTLVAVGTTTITASYEGDDTYAASTDTYELTVTDTRTATVTTIDDAGITNTDLKNGTAAGTLTANVTSGGDPVLGATVTWESSDPTVATITDGGVVTLVKVGTTTITASYAGGGAFAASSDTYELTVVDSEQKNPVTIQMTNSLFGQDVHTSGTAKEDLTFIGYQDNVKVTYYVPKDSYYYFNTSNTRPYNTCTLTYGAPEGYVITEIDFTSDGSNWNDATPSVGEMTATKIWEGFDKEVTFSWETTGTRVKTVVVTLAEVVTLTPAKTYTTLTSAYALDFTTVSDDLKAYIAKDGVSEGSVKMTQVNKVPANTGLVLKATTPNSAVNVPVFDGTGADDVTGNKMVGNATETTAIERDGGYILSNGVFQPADAGTLAAGKAYLQIAVTSARSLVMSFDDATTAINGIEEVAPVNVKTRKVVKNGRLVIETANGEFTIDGARMK